MDLQHFFAQHNKVALAFSGGVDSAYLLYAAKACGAQVKAYFVKTPFQPTFEYEDALRLARQLGLELNVLELDVLCDPVIAANPPDRCYHCKKAIFTAISHSAAQDGYPVVIDGTNASDDASDRPGMTALAELSVLSPLRLCGITKDQIRKLSKDAGLFTHDKPAYACLATRIPTGTPIDRDALDKTQQAEEYLKALGFRDFRIRMLGSDARIQVRQEQLPLVLEHRQEMIAELKKYYDHVLLDLEVRK